MRTGFQRHISRRTNRISASLRQSPRFAVRSPACLRPATPNHAPVFNDHAADSRIWPAPAQTTPPQGKGQRHPAVVSRMIWHGLFFVFGLGGPQFVNEILEIVCRLEVLVNAGKTHIGHGVNPRQSLHHNFADLVGIHVGLAKAF